MKKSLIAISILSVILLILIFGTTVSADPSTYESCVLDGIVIEKIDTALYIDDLRYIRVTDGANGIIWVHH